MVDVGLILSACLTADYSVVIKLDIGNEEKTLSYPHSYSLQSPAFPAPYFNMCLTLEHTSLAQFSVKLLCLKAGEDEVVEDVLRWSSVSQGFELHRATFVVPGEYFDCDKCLLSIDIEATKSGFLAAISSVTLTEGTCEHLGMFIY